MVRIATIAFALALSACAERPAVEDSSIDIDPVERQKMYLAQERAQLEAYIQSHELEGIERNGYGMYEFCLLYTSPSPRDLSTSRMPSSA